MAQPMTSEHTTARTTDSAGVTRTPVQIGAGLVGVAFLLVGVAGFLPGVTQDLGDMEWVGHESRAELLGLFGVNVTHNLVHLTFGLVGLWAARRARTATGFLLAGGAAYLALWLYGLAIDLDGDANVVALNTADNWLHLGLGAAMVLLGLVLRGRTIDLRDRRR